MVEPKPTPSPSPAPSTTGSLTPSADAAAAAASVPIGTTTGGSKVGLTGAPIGTPVLKAQTTRPGPKGRLVKTTNIYAKTQYSRGSGATAFATLNNNEKINLLAQLSQIPGLYPRGKAPTQEYLLRLAQGGVVGIREEDTNALEEVMRYADTVGDDYKTAVSTLVTNPTIAQGFFDISGGKGPKKVKLTPADALSLELEQSVLDYLDLKITDKEKKAYANKINALEKKRGGALTALERQQLLVDTVQEKALELYKSEANTQDSMLMRRGALGAAYNLLRETYADYGLPVDSKVLYKDAIQSIRSKQAMDNILNDVQLQAEVAMPGLKDYIRQGLTPRKALANHINLYSKIYGVPEESVTLDKLAPVYSGATIMPYTDWQKYLYTLPEFKNTQLYANQRLSDARTLINNFIGQVQNGKNSQNS